VQRASASESAAFCSSSSATFTARCDICSLFRALQNRPRSIQFESNPPEFENVLLLNIIGLIRQLISQEECQGLDAIATCSLNGNPTRRIAMMKQLLIIDSLFGCFSPKNNGSYNVPRVTNKEKLPRCSRSGAVLGKAPLLAPLVDVHNSIQIYVWLALADANVHLSGITKLGCGTEDNRSDSMCRV
jgi:hypothetical protein